MYKTIVVGTDGSLTARAAVQHATELAQLSGATLHIVCGHHEPAMAGAPEFVATGFDAAAASAGEAKRILGEARDDALARGVAVQCHGLMGSPAHCVVDTAQRVGADLVVVGNRGMHGSRRMLGSIPNWVTHHAACHVLVVQTCS